jgi:hypothetical protein
MATTPKSPNGVLSKIREKSGPYGGFIPTYGAMRKTVGLSH